jgi:hypothetical protein
VNRKALIIVPLVVAALAYAGIKGYIYYNVKTDLDRMVSAAAPFMQIEYGGIGSDLSGIISVDRLSLTPTGSYDEISIQRLELSGDGPGFLLELMHGFKQEQPPARMALSVHRLESPVTSTFLTNIGPRLGAAWNRQTDSCSLAGILKASGLKELGFPGLTINGDMGYTYDRDSGEVQFNLDYELAGVEATSLNLKASGISTAGLMGLGEPPFLQQLHLARRIQPGYMKQVATMCATNSGQSQDQFIEGLVTRPASHYLQNLGFIPGPGLKAMLKQLVTHAGELEILANPSSEINPANLSAYRPGDIIDLLGLTVSYNGNPVTDLSFSTRLKTPHAKTTAAYGGRSLPGEPGLADAQDSGTPPKLRYIETDVSRLEGFLLHRVRIYTLDNDKPKQGVLTSIRNQTVHVEQLLHNGKMTVHLHRDRIARVEVLRSDE